ncbi:MAG: hypothetical protein ABII64_00820 [Elusimicrobiota bacterium]
MREVICLAALMTAAMGIGSRAQAVVIWSADFSSSGIVNWLAYGTNAGSGNATFRLLLTSPADWTASATPGANQYVLNGAFASSAGAITWSEANHNLTTASATCTDTVFAGDQTGAGVPAGADRSLWLQFKAPTSVSSETPHTITVTVTAVAAP